MVLSVCRANAPHAALGRTTERLPVGSGVPKALTMSIKIRDARPDDKDAILALTRDIRTWGDHVQDSLDEWLTGDRGVLRVAEDTEGAVLAVQHYLPLDATQVWLSGLRVRRDMEGKGVAGSLLDDAIRMARAERMLVLRYAGEVTNEAIQRMGQERGLRPRETWLNFEREMDAAACAVGRSKGTLGETVTLLGPRDRLRALSLLHASGRTLYVEEWAWRALDDSAFSRLIKDQRCYLARSGVGGWSLALATGDTRTAMEVTIYGSDAACALALLEHLQRVACTTHDGVDLTVHLAQESSTAGLMASLVRRGEWRPILEHALRVWELDLTA